MKKTFLGAVVFFSLLALAGLSMYIYAARTGSGHRLKEFHRTAGFLEERIAALEKQRDLLGETAVALDGQAASLQRQAGEISRRAEQIDSEITNMRELIGGARKSVRTPLFSARGFRLTAGSGLVVIAFLAFIWLLYTSLRSREGDDDLPLDTGDASAAETAETVPGSVLEEEFPPSATEEAAGGDDTGGAPEEAGETGESPEAEPGAQAGESEPGEAGEETEDGTDEDRTRADESEARE